MNYEKGFTLIEVIIAVAILAVIVSLGFIIGVDFFRTYSFHSEGNTIVTLLENARSQSMNNVDQVRHGVHFDNPLSYMTFECKSSLPGCTSYADREPSNVSVFAPNYASTISSPGLPFDVIFDQLSGDCVVTTGTNVFSCDPSTQYINVNDGVKIYKIFINSEGMIDWH